MGPRAPTSSTSAEAPQRPQKSGVGTRARRPGCGFPLLRHSSYTDPSAAEVFTMVYPGSQQQTIEVHDWDGTPDVYGLVADFARIHVLLSIFDGDTAKWLEMIESVGTRTEKLADAPFLRMLQQRLIREPELIDELQRVVGEFARLVTPPPQSA